eukprot:6458693-Amphidinium_carterae.1
MTGKLQPDRATLLQSSNNAEPNHLIQGLRHSQTTGVETGRQPMFARAPRLLDTQRCCMRRSTWTSLIEGSTNILLE